VPGHGTGTNTSFVGGQRPVTSAKAIRVPLLVLTTAVLVAGCSSPSPTATRKGQTTTTTVATAACPASSIAASVDFSQFGGSSSSVAGAVLFHNTGSTSCSLRGVPQVQVVSTNGESIPTYQAPGFLAHLSTAVLPAGDATDSARAGSSFTISSWTCAVGSFSLTVRFAGWTTSIPATSGAPSGACPLSQEVDETLYVGPVTTVSG
jgi:hypothetical protein